MISLFNHHRPQLGSKSICELTSVPPNRVDNTRDFALDHRYDFYERDWSQRKCSQGNNKPKRPPASYPSAGPTTWWNAEPRPSWNTQQGRRGSYDLSRHSPVPRPRPVEPPVPGTSPYGGSFDENTRLTIEIPRPINPPRRRPAYNPDDNWLRPVDRPLPVRPLEDFYPPQNHHPRPPDRRGQDGFGYGDRMPPHGYERPHYDSRLDGYSGNGYSYGRPSGNRWQPSGPGYIPKWPQRRVGYDANPGLYYF